MRKLASIRLVDDILPIENADRLEQAVIGGWRVVVGKGEFKKGDEVVYFEIDSALPVEDERFSFLKERCLKKWMKYGELVLETIRIKSIKLRGVISQGIVMKKNIFPEIEGKNVGEDVTEILKVEHYDELAEKMGRITGSARIAGNAKGVFPSYITSRTDEERLQNLTEYFDGRMDDVEFEATEKADGSSMTVIYSPSSRENDPCFVCSRNLELKDEENNTFWEAERKYCILKKLEEMYRETGIEAAVQMELVGPGVNGNRDMFEEHEVRVFRIFNINDRRWFTPEERYRICEKLNLPHVKVIKKNWKVFKELKSMEDFLEFVKGKTDRGFEREGIVFKNNHGDISFKVINNDYLLKQKD